MKKYLVALLFGLMACRPQPIVQAPIVIPVEGVDVETEPQEKQYIPSVRWNVAPLEDEDGRTPFFTEEVKERGRWHYKFSSISATFTTEGRALNLECEGGVNATVTCVTDGAQVKMGCNIMLFRVSCELR